ncbi:hypothetical protein WJX74_007921 [Apatococcus lobatus]|uniref:Uncharacterized protein n=1 Tax=Apatococcus lobatus TaxID=904363 RepID=A0AAW1Q6B3_9CHLO
MRGVGPNMPLARRVASACHLSFLGRSAPESHRLLEPTTARPTLSSLSLEPDLGELPLDTGVFDLELSRHGSRHGSRNSSRHPSFNGSHTATSLRRPGQCESLALCQSAVPGFLTRKVLDWSWPQGLAETQLLQDVGHLRPLSRGLDGFEVPLLADGLTARGWEVQVCCQGTKCAQCKKARSGQTCLDNLHHQYIHCSRSPDGEAMDSIIEPRFKELFQIGPATPLFTGLLESVPQTFVGHPTRLALLAELLSAESVRAFKEGGWTLPPWRTVSSMLGKWGLNVPSRDAKDRSVLQDRSHHALHVGSPIAGPGILPPLPFEPARPMQPQQFPPAGRADASDSSQADTSAAVRESPPRPTAGLAGQQAPRGSFARLLLSGGLWGLQPEQGQPARISPTETSRQEPGLAEQSTSRQEHAAGSLRGPSAPHPAALAKSESDPGQIRDSPSHTSQTPQHNKQPARVSLLAQGLANEPKQQQQAQPAPFNPFQSWSHLLPPVTTVKRTGTAGPPKPGQPVRRPQ